MSTLRPVTGTAEEILALLRTWDAVTHEPEPLVVETSGSTGRPKRVVLSRRAMRASAHAMHRRLGGPGQWVLRMPPTFVGGLMVLYRGVVAGTTPAGRPEEAEGERRYCSLVPTQLHRLLRDGDAATAPYAALDAVLVGGGPLARGDAEAARTAGIRLLVSYGMSETCGGCVYDGLPLDGVRVDVDAGGTVLLAGPVLFEGYQDDPELTSAALRDGWLVTSDLGRVEEGRLTVLGRSDDVVLSGGVNVPASAVADALRAHPAVVAAEVVGVPDAEWGERVVALAETAGPVTLDELRDLVRPRAWAPRQLVVVPDLPRTASGKLDRVAARRLAGA